MARAFAAAALLLASCSSTWALDDVALIVDKSLYGSVGVESRLLRYKAEVEALFPVSLRICREASFEAYTPAQMRSYVTNLYNQYGVKGVVLVGQIKYALWKNYAPGADDKGINSFYYEDLDGTFTDTNADGYDDLHDWGTNVGPEVWCVWMRPPANNQVNALNAFLDKVHLYYFGGVAFNNRALVAAHQDYENNIRSGFRMVERLQALYGTAIDVDGEGTDPVVASEYLAALNTNRYDICDPMGHANAWLQAWDSGSVNYSSIRSMTGGAIMTFIYGCSSAAFNSAPSDNIAQAYVFGSGIGQAASGTSWSYGTEGKWYIYEELARGGYLGKGWWNLELTKNTPAYMKSRYGDWLDTNRHLWGDNLIGNPFVYAKYAPPQAMTLAEAKALPDGAAVIVTGVVVTANYNGEVYVEQANRVCGIKALAASSVALSRQVKLSGILGTDEITGERVIRYADITDLGTADPIRPLAMATRSLKGSSGCPGTQNIGLLVRITGSVTSNGTGWFTLDDGSALKAANNANGVKIRCDGISPPANGWRTVTGISTTEVLDGINYAVVRARSAGDIVTVSPNN